MRWLAYTLLRILGWRFDGVVPPDPKFVAIGAPHTSNWDFVVFLGLLWHFRLNARYLGKDTLFRWPLGVLMRKLGGIPVDRDRSDGVVEAATAAFDLTDSMILAIAPESTRGYMPYWRSGFYRIALAAGVPVLPAYIDRIAKRAGLGDTIRLTGDAVHDMTRIRSYYAAVMATPPERMGPIRLRVEDQPPGP